MIRERFERDGWALVPASRCTGKCGSDPQFLDTALLIVESDARLRGPEARHRCSHGREAVDVAHPTPFGAPAGRHRFDRDRIDPRRYDN